MVKKSNIFFLLLLIILVFPATLALFHPGFFLTDDGNWMVIRFSSFYENFREGQIPVRFLTRLNYGYGYPVADFLYPLFMYIGIPIHAIGFSFVNTIKIILGISLISSSFFSFLWLRKTFTNIASLIGALAYTLFPYHLWDVYKRGSVGEVLALAIIPFILWAIEKRNIFLISLGYGLLITSHNSLAFIFIPIIFIYHLILPKNNFLNSLFCLVIGLSLSAFFWIPALYDKQFTVFDRIPVSNYADYFISLKNINLFGITLLFSIILSLFFILKKDLRFIYFAMVTIFSIFFTLPISAALWNSILANLIQFPFRFISLTILGVSYLVAYQINSVKIWKKAFILIYLFLIFISARSFISPSQYQNYPDTFYSTNQDSTTVKNEYMPKWVGKIPNSSPEKKIKIVQGKGTIGDFRGGGSKFSFNVNLVEKSVLEISKIYFPGWEAKLNGKKTVISYDNKYGLIHLVIPSGKHKVDVGFKETNIRLISDLISLATVFLLLSWFLLIKKGIIIKAK